MRFPVQHRAKLHSTNPLERLNGEIKRRSEVVGIFPNEAAITRLIGALLLEQNDEWAAQRARYMGLETIAPSAMMSPSACHPWQPDRAANPAQEQRSYTTARDTIPSETPAPGGNLNQVLTKPAAAHVAPRAADPQPAMYAVEKPTVVLRRPRPAATMRRQQAADDRPIVIRQIAAHAQVSAKTSVEARPSPFRENLRQRDPRIRTRMPSGVVPHTWLVVFRETSEPCRTGPRGCRHMVARPACRPLAQRLRRHADPGLRCRDRFGRPRRCLSRKVACRGGVAGRGCRG